MNLNFRPYTVTNELVRLYSTSSAQFICSVVSQFFVTPWTAARETSLSIINSWSLLRLTSIKSVMPSNHLILCHSLLLLLPSVFPSMPPSKLDIWKELELPLIKVRNAIKCDVKKIVLKLEMGKEITGCPFSRVMEARDYLILFNNVYLILFLMIVVVVQSPNCVHLFATPGQQHARPLCSSLSPIICPSSCPLHGWCHPAISSSDTLFSFCPQSFPASGTFPLSQLFASDDQNTEVSASASVLPMNTQGWFPLRMTGLISLLSKWLSGIFSSTTFRGHKFFSAPPYLQSSSHNSMWPLGRPQPWLYGPLYV